MIVKSRTYWYIPITFLAPVLLLFSIYVIYPILQSLWLSLHQWAGVGEKTWVGLKNYLALTRDPRFFNALKNNLWWLILLLLAPVFGLTFSVFLNQQIAGMKFVKSLFFFPFVVNLVVVGLMYSWFYNPDFGLLTKVLSWFSLPPIPILSDENIATFGIIFAALWPQTAYCMILYLTGLTALDRNIIEAARVDGAYGWKMFTKVILPQLRPATFIATVITVIGALRSFDLVAIMTAGGPWGSTYVLAYQMYVESLFNFKMGYGAAIATVLFLVMNIYIAYFLSRVVKSEQG